MNGIYPKHLRELIIRPVLKDLERCGVPYSEVAEELLVFTAAVESNGGRYLKQRPTGPALGIYQMEPSTFWDMANFLPSTKIDGLFYYSLIDRQKQTVEQQLVWNLAFATAACRLQYWRFPEPLPSTPTEEALARYWKTYWNTAKGKGNLRSAIVKYQNWKDQEAFS